MSRAVNTSSVAETIAAGRALAGNLRGGETIALDGDLGAGKTHFVKGIAEGLGYTGEVTSPTFTLIHEYAGGRLLVAHADLYRIDGETEAERAGLFENLDNGSVLVVEWAGKFPGLFDAGTIRVHMAILGESEREIRIAES